MTFENEGICVEAVKTWYLCRQPGRGLYSGLRDRLFGAPGIWSLLKCTACDLALRTTSRGARMMFKACQQLQHETDYPKKDYRPGRCVALGSWAFLASTEARRLVNGRAGDMLILTATRSE